MLYLCSLMLYDILDLVGTRALYMDTDSIIFWGPKGLCDEPVKMGIFLGDWTDELNSSGTVDNYIVEFVSGMYEIYIDVKVCIKGITVHKEHAKGMPHGDI